MKFKAKLKRLECLVGIGQRCARCRLCLREAPESDANKPKNDFIAKICEECGTQYNLRLESYSQSEREAIRMFESYSSDDIYIAPKAHALDLWLRFRPNIVEAIKNDRKSHLRNNNKAKPKTKGARLYLELIEQTSDLETKRHERLIAKYGKRFPEQDALVKDLIGNNFEEPELKAAVARGKLEEIIWGEPLPETMEELERIVREKREKEEEKQRQLEEQKRRDEELLERNRREIAERQQQAQNPITGNYYRV